MAFIVRRTERAHRRGQSDHRHVRQAGHRLRQRRHRQLRARPRDGIHPTNCNTRLLHNDGVYARFRPDLENPTREDVLPAFATLQLMPGVPYIEPEDISNAVVFLASDEARYITGEFISVDAGAHLKLLE
jgi:hypothetical protein